MWERKPQTYANHGRLVPPYHFVIFTILVVYLLRAGWFLVQPLFAEGVSFSWHRVLGFLFALSILGIFFYTRTFALAVQDRVIRLEMRLRLQEVLPPDLRGRIGDLSTAQLVGLRFAGDGELPALVKAALDENLSGGDIKKRIQDWQPDYQRV